jgi:hypothetical protein
VSAVIKDEYKPYRAGDIEWIYPHEQEPPTGADIHILTEGGIAIRGQWQYGNGYLGWQYMFKRNKGKEAEYRTWLETKGKKL